MEKEIICKKCKRKPAATSRVVCNKCRSKAWRTKNPIAYVYLNLKHNARKRDILFQITLIEFKEFIEPTEYMKKRGNCAGDLTIDRKKGDEGYHKDNLDILTRSENASKYHNKKREYGGYSTQEDTEEYPF